MPAHGRVTVDEERCKGCELCIPVCPVDILEMSDRTNSHGHRVITVSDMSPCTGCTLCARICPDQVFVVYKDLSERELEASPMDAT
jgi:2-oxoglutarate ferredoxin oxidoreductase subunit delta